MAAAVALFALPALVMCIGSILMCCDERSPSVFGVLYRVFGIYIPNLLKAVISFFPGGKYLISGCTNTYVYVFQKPNPLMQGFYLLLVVGGFSLFVQYGFPLLPNRRLGPIHIFLPFILVAWTLFTFIAASVVPPGYVTARNAPILEKAYKYDGFLFVKQECSTCKTPKVARSKHCRMMGRCVEKYDHYCPWINNTVGALNFRFFLIFVFSTAVFLVYGTYVFYNILMYIIYERDRLWEVKFINTGTNEVVKADWRVIFQFMMAGHGMLMFLFVLCAVMGLTLVAFFLYQLYMVKIGTTANEAQKWADVKDFYASGKWKREQEARGKEYTPDSELIKETAEPLTDRMIKDFPSQTPPNIYNLGFWENLKDVIWPESENQKRIWARTQQAAAAISNNTTDNQAPKGVSKSSEPTSPPARSTSGKRKNGKKKD